MIRSKWKLVNLGKSKKLLFKDRYLSNNKIYITKELINNSLVIYNGKFFKKVLVQNTMLNHYLGEFVRTRFNNGKIHDINFKKKK